MKRLIFLILALYSSALFADSYKEFEGICDEKWVYSAYDGKSSQVLDQADFYFKCKESFGLKKASDYFIKLSTKGNIAALFLVGYWGLESEIQSGDERKIFLLMLRKSAFYRNPYAHKYLYKYVYGNKASEFYNEIESILHKAQYQQAVEKGPHIY